ncbi:endonuclease/exonuclease/phosphatase family protein [Cellulomonas rhizosphaerae]|nr:endonuclease/exonuclease/phosphatase family protein [Cellulomonas rhizosphaerae]
MATPLALTAPASAETGCVSTPDRDGSPSGEIKVGTYNVAGDGGRALARPWEGTGSRSFDVAVRVVKYNPDIVGFQEAPDPQADSSSNPLRASMECRGYKFAVGGAYVSPTTKGLAIYYNPNSWKKIAPAGVGTIPAKEVWSGLGSDRYQDRGAARTFVYQTFESKLDGKKYTAVNVHLSAGVSSVYRLGSGAAVVPPSDVAVAIRMRSRSIQLKDVILNQLPSDAAPQIFLGDFNDYGYAASASDCTAQATSTESISAMDTTRSQTFCFMTQAGYKYRDNADPGASATSYGLKTRVTSTVWRSGFRDWNANVVPALPAASQAVAQDTQKFNSYWDDTANAQAYQLQGRHLDHVYFPTSVTITDWREVLELSSGEYASGVIDGTQRGYTMSGTTVTGLPNYSQRDSDHSFVWSTGTYAP